MTPRRQARRTASRRQARRTAALVAALTLLLGACTAEEPRSSETPSASSPATTSASAEPSVAVVPAAAAPPRGGACYDLDYDEATSPTHGDRPVRCSGRHTSQTFYVGRLDTVVDGHLLAVDSERAQAQVREACPRRLAGYVGGSARDRRLSRLEAVWFSPTIEQSDQGASWFRCDVVGLARGRTLAPLPPPRVMRGILSRRGALDEVGLCGTAEPGSPRFDRVICSQPHTWKALTTLDMRGGSRYPGAATLRRAGEETCRDHVRRASGSPEEFRYGWEWPTREQWRAGQHYGFCWAPD